VSSTAVVDVARAFQVARIKVECCRDEHFVKVRRVNPKRFFAELKRRNVYKVAITYAVVAWLLVQASSILLPTFEAPTWVMKAFVVFLALGFVISVMISWAFEATPEGLKRTENVPPDAVLPTWSPRKFATFIVAVAVIAAGLLAFNLFRTKPSAPPTTAMSNTNKSIAVLPFVNMGADKADEYLSDGMTEELLNALTKVKQLRVPGRSSSFAFKGKNEEGIFRKVGQELHVNTVLEGSVRKAGDKLRVTAQLINVADGFHLWSETYDGEMKDILTVQSDVAKRVVQALQVQLGVDEARALAKKPTENPEAHRLYLLGRYHFAKFTRAGWTNAIHYFEQALQRDPNFALAYCGLADTYGWGGGQIMAGREAWAKEMELAQKALALDPKLAEAHLAMGTALFSVLGPHASEKELDRAVELNPNLALAYDQYGWTFGEMGRFDEAIAAEKKALELDPLNNLLNTDLAFFLYWARRYEDAITQIRKTLELDSNNGFAHLVLGWCLIGKGSKADARAEFQKATTLDDLPWYVGSLGYACAVSGDRAKAEQALRELEELAKQRYVSPANRATVYLGLGENEKALDWLEKAYEDRDPIFWWINGDQLYDSVRHEPRFQVLLKKVGPR
jgi:serine/threonine-protein kinase